MESTEKQQEVSQGLQDFIFASKYARWIPELKRRETWDEAVDRVCNMHLEKFSELPLEDKKEIEWAFSLVKEKRVLPSMRSMQFGGKAQLAHEVRGYNCLEKQTRFITRNGVKSFVDFKDGDTTQVLSHNGIWREAVVKNYGKQTLYPVNISRAKNKFTIWATKDHKWFLKNEETTTTLEADNLLLGAYNIFSEFDYGDADIDEKLYWTYGYVYGDGTRVKNKDGIYTKSMVRLCGLEKQRYLHRFLELGFKSSEPLSCSGDAVCYTGSYLKTAPNPEVDDPRLIRAFVRGYLDADGAKDSNINTANQFTSIQSSEIDHIDFIRQCFPIAGVYINSEKELTGQITNYGVRPYTVLFRINTCPQRKKNSNHPFRVDSIGDNSRYEDVWCLEVEDDASFTLPNGLVTGNCSCTHVTSIRSFAELAYMMLCGTGTGIGLSKRHLSRLPSLVDQYDKTGSVTTYVIEDSIEGWADSLEALLMCYFKNNAYSGRKIIFDYSKIRRKGTALKTGGGRAPGYKPLKAAHDRIKRLLDRIIENDNVSILRPIHAYDILMFFADAVLSGGVRRTASSIIFDIDDEEMISAKTYFPVDKFRESLDEETNINHLRIWVNKRFHDVSLDMNLGRDKYAYDLLKHSKTISWMYIEPQRARSNNSVLLLRSTTSKKQFEDIVAKTRQFGEPGFVWADDENALYNPCFEFSSIPISKNLEFGTQFCNLTTGNGELIISKEMFMEVVRAQAIIGTLQAGYTNFPYLTHASKDITEEEAVLGLSLTGILSNPDILLKEEYLKEAAEYAIVINKEWAAKLNINPAARVTVIKPEGTGSLAIGVHSPGIHAAHGYNFFKRVQTTKGDPIYEFFKMYNPHMCEESVWSANGTDDVITFPIEVSKNTIIKDDISALQHLKIIKTMQEHWVIPGGHNTKKNITNNVSCTVIVREDEWDSVIEYIYDNRHLFSAVSMIDYLGDKIYPQAPFEKVVDKADWERYNMLLDNYSPVDFSKLEERADDTTLVQESSCAGGACLI